MPLTQYPITGSLRDALDTGPQVHGTLLFVPYGSHDSRVEDDNVLLGPIRENIVDLDDPYLLDEGSWTVTISTTHKPDGRYAFKPITVSWEHDSATTWADIISGVVTDIPVTPTLLQQAEAARDEAEVFSATTVALQDAAVASLANNPASAAFAALAARFAQVGAVDVRRYGTIGTADDRVVFQAAIDAAATLGAKVYIPRKSTPYNVSKSGSPWCLKITDGCKGIIGDGIGSTVIKVTDASADGAAILRGDSLTGVEIAHLTLDGNNGRAGVGATGEGEGINLKSCTNVLIHHVEAKFCGQDGIDLDNLASGVVSDCLLHDNFGLGIHVAGTSPYGQRVTLNNIVTMSNGQERGLVDPFAAGVSISGNNITVTGHVSVGDQRGLEVVNASNCYIQTVCADNGSASTADHGVLVSSGSDLYIDAVVTGRGTAAGAAVAVMGGNAIKVDVVAKATKHAVIIDSAGGDVAVSGRSILTNSDAIWVKAIGANKQVAVRDFTATTPGAAGVRVDVASVQLDGVVVVDPTTHGIDLRSSSALANGVKVRGAGQYGAAISGSTNRLVGCDFSGTSGAVNDTGSNNAIESTWRSGNFVSESSSQLILAESFLGITGTPDLVSITTGKWIAYRLDASTQEAVVTTVPIPATWKGVNIDLLWTVDTAITGDVRWQLSDLAVVDGGNLAAGAGSRLVTATAPAQQILKHTRLATSYSVTSGSALGLRVHRIAADAADTLTGDACVLGILLTRVN